MKDVYKRQLLLRVIGDKSGSEIAVESLCVGRLRVVGGSGYTVSYTHLDVYKRQLLRFALTPVPTLRSGRCENAGLGRVLNTPNFFSLL